MKKSPIYWQFGKSLLPGAAEMDEGFRQELLRIGHAGLRAVGGVEIGAAAFLALTPAPQSLGRRLLEATIPCVLGVATIAL